MTAPDSDIAIIGLAGRFPRAPDAETFWRNILADTESMGGLPGAPGRAGNGPPLRCGLEDIEYFDAAFFEVSDEDAALIDPQFRLFTECAWQALEDAACNPGEPEMLVGVFAGASANTYLS